MQRVEFLNLIDERLAELGMSAADASTRAVGNHYLIRNMRRRDGAMPSVESLQALCKVLGIEFYVGPPRPAENLIHSESYSETGLSPAQLRDLESSTHTLVRVVSDAGGDPIPDDLREALLRPDEVAEDRAGYEARGIEIEAISEVRAAAGAGSEVWDETVTDKLVFRRSWLAKHNLTASQCTVIRTTGSSMEPTLPSGCSILVNHASRRRLNGRVFVLRTEDGLIVKRLHKTADGWQIASDNPEVPPRPMTPTDEIIGEVVWLAKTLR